ncbi:MAG: hypothetical protein Q4Q62_05295 [Thermoplasmata archaeon]|nr:hypothetical protein [Thermoplasmata archaeon]
MTDYDKQLTATLAMLGGTIVALSAAMLGPTAPDALLGLILEAGTVLVTKLVILGE